MKKNKILGPLKEETTKVILDCISDGVFTIDYNWEITSFNRAAEEITGIPKKLCPEKNNGRGKALYQHISLYHQQ